jgi:hypothetical protein
MIAMIKEAELKCCFRKEINNFNNPKLYVSTSSSIEQPRQQV